MATYNSAQLFAIHPFEIKPGDLGVTVRRGTKWHDIFEERGGAGTNVDLVQTSAEFRTEGLTVGHAALMSANVMLFKDIPASLIQYEHEASSRLYDGLFESMKRAYGDDFTMADQVTVLVYRRID